METITALDEAKLLGYFETIRGVFLTKFVFLAAFTKDQDGAQCFDYATIPKDAVSATRDIFDDPLFYKALERGNSELHQSYTEDLVTSLFTSSWNVFEQITKDLTRPDYATYSDELSVCYQNGRFQFGAREKKDIELFYYMRNAIYHYNGAYYASKDIDHRYKGKDFKSTGHCGEKMDINVSVAYAIASDIERYTIKAWVNATNFSKSAP